MGDGDEASAPVGIEDSRRVAAEQGNLVGHLAPLAEGDDGEGAATAGLPIDREVFGVDLDRRQHETNRAVQPVTATRGTDGRAGAYLHQVCVPGIATDAEVVVAELLPGGLAKDMSC
jgi:hypothetical protein